MVKSILVAGATGKQGGAAITALLADNAGKGTQEWKIYALTRNAQSDKAKALEAKGNGAVELVQGDFDDAAFITSFVTKEKDLYAIFAVTLMGKNEVPLRVSNHKSLYFRIMISRCNKGSCWPTRRSKLK